MKALAALLVFALVCGCAQKPPPVGIKRQVLTVAPKTEPLRETIVQAKANVTTGQKAVRVAQTESAAATSATDKAVAAAAKIVAEGTTAGSEEAKALVAELDTAKTSLFRVTMELRATEESLDQALEDLAASDRELATVKAQAEAQTTELSTVNTEYNASVDREQVTHNLYEKQKDDTLKETIRANGWRNKFWWVGSAFTVCLLAYAAKVYFLKQI